MIDRIVTFSVERRWFVLLLTAIAAIIGGWALTRLPIDAVPDITNKQVQVNVRAPALSPDLVEKQVAFPIETALAGVPGLENTRSLSRNGFAQVTAVFSEGTDIYFARQQVAERLRIAEESLPSGVVPEMGPIATGLGEVYMWTVRLAHRSQDKHEPGQPGLQPDGSYITPEGERLTSQADQATYLRTVQDWIVTPLLKNTDGIAGVDTIGGYVKQYQVVPDVQRLAALRLSLDDLANALEQNNTGVGAGVVDRNGEGLAVRSDARIADAGQLANVVVATREGVPILLSQVATVKTGQAIRMGSASENGREVVVGTAVMRIGENSRAVSSAVADRLKEINASLPADVIVQPVLDRTKLVNSTIETVATSLGVTGVLADSSALIANGLDNASDGIVYIISLLALARSQRWKRGAAMTSGVLLLLFAAGVLFDAGRRYFIGSEPIGPTMIGMAIVAAIVNGLCLWLLKRLREPDVNLRAATTFSLNDFISNGGVIVAGGIVMWTGQNWPDLVLGFAVAAIAIKGGIEILNDARAEAVDDDE